MEKDERRTGCLFSSQLTWSTQCVTRDLDWCAEGCSKIKGRKIKVIIWGQQDVNSGKMILLLKFPITDFDWAGLFTKLFVQMLRINCWICSQKMIKMVIKEKFQSKLFLITSVFLTCDAEQSSLYFVLCVLLSSFRSHFLLNHPRGIVLQSGHTTLSSSCGALFLGICPDFSSVHCSAVRWSSQDRRLNPPPRYKSPNTIYRLS